MYDLGIIDGLVYIDSRFIKTNVYIKNGIIEAITPDILEVEAIYSAKGYKVMPGLIDSHVHFALDCGKVVSTDDFESGSISAAYGGITTIFDFLDPINKGEDLEKALENRKALASKSVIDYGFHATVKNPVNEVENIVKEMKRLDLNRVKLFTTYSDSNRRTYDEEVKTLLKLSNKENFMVLVHVEDDEQIVFDDDFIVTDLLKSRPSSAETKEALKLAEIVKETNGKLYMVHCSSGETIKALKESYSELLNNKFIIESCPHYFVLDSSIWCEEEGYRYTMAPPLRTKEEQLMLKELIDDVVTIGTDHCPFTKDEKNKEKLKDIPMGIGGVEQSFHVMYSLFGEKIINKMTLNPAKVHGLYPKKGTIKVGSDGDLVIFKESAGVISEHHSKCDYNVYEGHKINTEIKDTISRGKFVIKDGKFIGGLGQYIRG